MNKPPWFHLPITVVVIAMLAAMVVWIIGLVNGWGALEYSNGMFLAGGAAIAVLLMSLVGMLLIGLSVLIGSSLE